MPLYTVRPIANGLHTDHPVPNLPFVADDHIPLEDPAAIEAIGRHKADGMHGREDRCADGGWLALTTDPLRPDLAWVVRWHPAHGRSVTVYRDSEAFDLHGPMLFDASAALLFRAGGYWWDGTTWYRPGQIWDGANEHFFQRPVPAAATVHAIDLLGDADHGNVWTITDLDVDTILSATAGGSSRGRQPDHWRNDLALWAVCHHDADPSRAVVTLTAPELSGDQLVGVAEMAEIAGISASTLRAYISRGEGEVPLPQSTVSGHSVWARPVAEEWAERRRRSDDGLAEALGGQSHGINLAPGTADVWERFSRSFFARLWSTGWRKRWSLRWRTETAVKEIADTLSWDVAASLDKLIPIGDLSYTIQQAVLRELAYSQHLERSIQTSEEMDARFLELFGDRAEEDWTTYAIGPVVARMLDWLIRHNPPVAGHAISQIIGEAGRSLDIARPIAERSIAQALVLDSPIETPARREYLTRVLSPDFDA